MGVAITSETVYDQRDVNVGVEGAPTLYTPAGQRPIEPRSVRLSYDIPTRSVRSIVVVGKGEPNPRNYRERDGYVRRRVAGDATPPWLGALIEKYRP